MSGSFKLKTFENVGYNAFGKVIQILFQSAANIILARNLASSDYGIAGFAMIVISFMTQFGDLGIHAAAVQAKELDEKGLYTGFAVKAALGLAACAVVLILAPLAGLLFDNGAVVNVVRLLSLNFVINSFTFLPSVALTRELNCRKLVSPQLVSIAVNSTLAIFMARSGFGYWSIILANVLSTAALAAAINIIHPVKIRFLYDRQRAVELLRFSGSVFFSGLLTFLILNVDNFAIGVVGGAVNLGYYALAFNWGSMICGLLGSVVLSVLFPTFARFQGDRQRLKSAYRRVLEYVGFAGILANAGLWAVSKEFLFFILGRGSEKWLPALAALQILCFYGVIRVLLEPVGSVILAMGKVRNLLAAQMAVAAVELLLLYPALKFFGIEGVAVAVTTAYLFQFIVLYPLLRRELGLGLAEWAAPVLPAVLAALVAGGVSFITSGLLPFSLPGMIVKMAVFTGAYCAVYGALTKWKMAGEIKDIIAEYKLRGDNLRGSL